MSRRAAGVVLTGGASRRMGTDKALVEVAGVAMAAHVAGVLRGAGCEPVWCQGGDADRLDALGLAVRPDSAPGGGPVAAIASALESAAALPVDGLVVAACDLPELTDAAVQRLLAAAPADAPAALAVDGQAQLVSWWPMTTRLPAGVRSYRAALEALGALLVESEHGPLHNVNTPEDLPSPG